MRRTLISFLALGCLIGLAFAGMPLGDWGSVVEPGVDWTGGPDAYGYTGIDSDEPGGPAYAWKDISATGITVTGLGDENYVGPFPIGFPFHYYWYDVTQYWIGSNGYIKFGTPYTIAYPFPTSIPLTVVPNDFLAAYISDLTLEFTGSCYRWNNVDSLVVSWINVPAWSTGGSHTFQIIMSRLDSSLTFQYGNQTGSVFNNALLIGIENNNGQVGLLRSYGTYPTSNYAIYWDYPASTSYVVHDLAATASGNANSEGFFMLNGSSISPWGRVKNTGNQNEATFQVNCTIQAVPSGTAVYNQTITAGPLAAGADLDVTFSPTWTAATNGQYVTKIRVNLAGDMNPNNNLKVTETRVMGLPGTMQWDDGTSEQDFTWQWSGVSSGLGLRFVPPSYPVQLDTVKFFIGTTSATLPFTAQVRADDGPEGQPGTILFTQDVMTTAADQWYNFNVASQNIQIAGGAIYLVWLMTGTNSPAIGLDTTFSIGSRQSWEYIGVWAPFREGEAKDPMMRAVVHIPGAVPDVTISMDPVGAPIIIPPTGGSFDFNVTVTNGGSTPQTFDGWIMVHMPTGPWYGPVLGPVTLTLPPGGSITRLRTQFIPGSAPAGLYTYEGRVGDYPNTIWHTDSFTFTKEAAQMGGGGVGEWSNTGESFETAQGTLPGDYSLALDVHPNPFNPLTTVSYTLSEAGQIVLSVYDLSGRLVSNLTKGWQEAGAHAVTFDASNLASGVYLYRLETAGISAVGKMVLMK